jgi:hypothetical protein
MVETRTVYLANGISVTVPVKADLKVEVKVGCALFEVSFDQSLNTVITQRSALSS